MDVDGADISLVGARKSYQPNFIKELFDLKVSAEDSQQIDFIISSFISKSVDS